MPPILAQTKAWRAGNPNRRTILDSVCTRNEIRLPSPKGASFDAKVPAFGSGGRAFAAANEPLDLWGWSELGSPRTRIIHSEIWGGANPSKAQSLPDSEDPGQINQASRRGARGRWESVVTNLRVRGCALRAQVGGERGHPPGRGPLLLLLLHGCLWLCLGVSDLQR